MAEPTYRLIRNALGFYEQVEVEPLPAEDTPQVTPQVETEPTSESCENPPVAVNYKQGRGRPRKRHKTT